MIEVADLVSTSVSTDRGIILRFVEQTVNEFDFHQDSILLAEVYWQKLGRSRLEVVSELKKLN